MGGFSKELVRLFEADSHSVVVSLKGLLASSALTETGRQCIKLVLDSVKRNDEKHAKKLITHVNDHGEHISSHNIVK